MIIGRLRRKMPSTISKSSTTSLLKNNLRFPLSPVPLDSGPSYQKGKQEKVEKKKRKNPPWRLVIAWVGDETFREEEQIPSFSHAEEALRPKGGDLDPRQWIELGGFLDPPEPSEHGVNFVPESKEREKKIVWIIRWSECGI